MPGMNKTQIRKMAYALVAAIVLSLIVGVVAIVRFGGVPEDEDQIAQLTVGLKENPNDPRLHLALGEEYAKQGRLGLAEQHLRKSVEIDPGLTAGKVSLGGVLHSGSRWIEAMELLREAVNEEPSNADARNNLGLTLYHLGMYKEAAAELEEAVKLEPEGINQLINLASVRAAQEKFDVATDHLKKVLELDPRNEAAKINLVQIAETVKRTNDPNSQERNRAMLTTSTMSTDELVDMLQNGSSSERAIAAWRLGKQGDRDVVEAIRTALDDEDANVQTNAIWALSRLGDRSDTARLQKLLLNETAHIRVFAAAALVQFGNMDGTLELVAAMRMEDPALREIAHKTLCAMAGKDLGETPEPWERWAQSQ